MRHWRVVVMSVFGTMLLFVGIANADIPSVSAPGHSTPITGTFRSSPMNQPGGIRPQDSVGTIHVDGTGNSAGDQTVTITAPTGQQSGDTIIAIQYAYTCPTCAHGPSGFTDIGDYSSGLTNVHVYRGVPASSYTFTHSSNEEVFLYAISGADPDWAINAGPTFAGLGSPDSATEPAPSVTPTVSNALLITAAGTAGPDPHTYTTPSGMTGVGSVAYQNNFMASAYQVLSGGAFVATGTRTYTANDTPSDTWATVSLAIAPTQGYDTSSNWAGYVVGGLASGVQFKNVQTTYVQPTVTCDTNNVWDLFWAGFDGFNNTTVEQAGTGVDCTGQTGGTVGVPHYFAWWETVPANSIQVVPSVTINPGDTIRLIEQYNPATGEFTLSTADLTNSQQFTQDALCGSPSGCQVNVAEAVAERTEANNGSFYDLGVFPDFQFTNTRAESTADTITHVFASYPLAPVQMQDSTTGDILATPSPFDPTGANYTVRWKARR